MIKKKEKRKKDRNIDQIKLLIYTVDKIFNNH